MLFMISFFRSRFFPRSFQAHVNEKKNDDDLEKIRKELFEEKKIVIGFFSSSPFF